MQRNTLVWVTATVLCGCGSETPAGSQDDSGSGGIISGGTAASDESGSAGGTQSDSGSGMDDDTASGGGGGGIPKFDVGAPHGELDCSQGGGGGGGGAADFSYIWVANSSEGTVSKINTQTLAEEGRYIVRPDSAGSPSRTSVNLNGDMAVANRLGGVTMIRARVEDCLDPGNTSTGPGDVKPWQDGCISWHTPFTYDSQRPVAWTQGEFNPGSCRYDNTKLWTSGATGEAIEVLLIDGETGVVEQTVPIPGVSANFYGIYGAAVDADGNFWGSQLSLGQLVRVSLDDFSVDTWPMGESGYGMTVDHLGRVWTCSTSVARFDPATETWQSNPVDGSGGGCMEDGQGLLWFSGYDYDNNYAAILMGIDIETLQISKTIPIPQWGKGISIDFEGNVWAVTMSTEAYRVNPVTDQVDTFTGLTGPYTYSDMTGFALSNAGSPAG